MSPFTPAVLYSFYDILSQLSSNLLYPPFFFPLLNRSVPSPVIWAGKIFISIIIIIIIIIIMS